ncbi:MAG: PD-(D/E)XK nuclease family protein [Candidatus Caldarchaeum sp.]
MPRSSNFWKLSPSGLYGFEECPACFWLEHHCGKPPGIPFVLNAALDNVFKARFDSYRARGEMPPELESLQREGVSLYPKLVNLNQWRNSARSLEVCNERVGYILSGKIDDLLMEPDGRLIPIDFKVSGYAPKEEKQKYYILQLHAYALMLREQGFNISDRAYLIYYFIRDLLNPSLSVEFESQLDRVDLDLQAFEQTLMRMVELLEGPYPGDNPDCPTCQYHGARMRFSTGT